MKSTILILVLAFISFSLSGQSRKETRDLEKAERIEYPKAKDAAPTDLQKVAKHIKNAGWSFLAATGTTVLALDANSRRRARERRAALTNNPSLLTYDPVAQGYSVAVSLSSIFFVINGGIQLIKAGWELGKGKK